MMLAANQPYFIPYFPYWQLIHAADIFLIADDYAFIKQGWINRNRIMVKGKPMYYRIHVEKESSHTLISNMRMVEPDVNAMLRTLEVNYKRKPYYSEGRTLMENILSCTDRNLAGFLTHSMQVMCEYLGIETRFMLTSQLEGNNLLRREHRAYDFCHRLGAHNFVNAIGGRQLYSYQEFAKQGIKLHFLHSNVALHHPDDISFANGLSIIDTVMRHSREELHDLLDDYTLIDESNDIIQ